MEYKKLFEIAKNVCDNAYAPYSKFRVGAALLCHDGTVYEGANIENSSYGATICAERVAMSKAVFDGKRKFKAIAIYSPQKEMITPCGICRQFMGEFDSNIEVVISDDKWFSLKELMPYGFDM